MISASAVSRALASSGIRPLPSGTERGREGVRVSGSGSGSFVAVSILIDTPTWRNTLTNEVMGALAGAGYEVTNVSSSELGNYLTVVKKGA